MTKILDQFESKPTQKYDLKKHIMSVHENVKYPCDECAFKAAEKGYLKRHKMSVHVKVKYHCD